VTTTRQATQETVAASARDLTETSGRGDAQVHALRGGARSPAAVGARARPDRPRWWRRPSAASCPRL